jgi:hypothetical protein
MNGRVRAKDLRGLAKNANLGDEINNSSQVVRPNFVSLNLAVNVERDATLWLKYLFLFASPAGKIMVACACFYITCTKAGGLDQLLLVCNCTEFKDGYDAPRLC